MVHVQNQHEQKYVETIITCVHPLLQVGSSSMVHESNKCEQKR